MLNLSQENTSVLIALKEGYDALAWYQRLLFPENLRTALEEFNIESPSSQAWNICNAFLKDTWFFQRWFFSALQVFNSSSLVAALIEMNKSSLLTGDAAQANFNAVAGFNKPDSVAFALFRLGNAKLLTGDAAQANFEALMGHQDPSSVANAISAGGLLRGDTAQAEFDALVRHQDPRAVAEALLKLCDAKLITSDNCNAVAGHQDPISVAYNLVDLNNAYIELNSFDLLTGDTAQANRDAVARHQNPGSVASALTLLSRYGLLTGDTAQANRDAVAGNQCPHSVASALIRLNDAGLLTGDTAQANRDAVAGHQTPEYVATALILLSGSGLLTGDTAQANRNAVTRHQHPRSVASALTLLSDAGLLRAQGNFNDLLTYSAILFGPQAQDLWFRIPGLTTERFHRIIEIAAEHRDNVDAGQDAFVNFVNLNLLHMDAVRHRMGAVRHRIGAVRRHVFNDGQSTHSASVHQSVSASATKLFQRYGTQLSGNGLNELMHQLIHWGNELPADNSLNTEAAKRCLKRLTAIYYTYTDEVSKVSTRELLALSWLAIHDEANRMGSLDDAKMQFIEGLYEIQRGYNLSELGVDDGNPDDQSICIAGTFNKLMEKLQGLHPDVEVLFITQQAAALKFPLVVKEEAMKYLTELSQQQPTGLSTELLKQIQDEGVSAILKHISKNVTNRILDEFGALYNNSAENGLFKALMATAEYVDLGDLSNFEKTITSSNKNAFFQPHDALIEEPQLEALLPRNTQ